MVSINKLKTLQYNTFPKKTLFFSIICSIHGSEDEKSCQEEKSLGILKILGLIKFI